MFLKNIIWFLHEKKTDEPNNAILAMKEFCLKKKTNVIERKRSKLIKKILIVKLGHGEPDLALFQSVMLSKRQRKAMAFLVHSFVQNLEEKQKQSDNWE
ncbi:hypothetical protein BpHYR1_030573 [Brachionus plicatilis]|uniref:Uncharacterized protein n=1 Tax=Brachionus plicatilis TaxID=10195 RepID=A0A3M7SRH1_BRAPC|nr:hypothetical protein BpHYR1_030573 [Brachionus plicatilis]